MMLKHITLLGKKLFQKLPKGPVDIFFKPSVPDIGWCSLRCVSGGVGVRSV
jgi:hypothetical protein